MQGVVYAVRIRQRWIWRVSLHAKTDAAYWRGLLQKPVRMLRIEPALSWGQAGWLREGLERTAGDGRLDKPKLAKALAALEPGLPGLGPHSRKSLRLEDWQDEPGPRLEEREMEARLPAAYRMAAGLAGRSLLEEEWRQWLEVQQEEERAAEADRLSLLQLANLQGWLELTTGLSCGDPGKAATKQDRKHRCRRCGSGEASMSRSFCLACGGDCAYCEACLGMGRARFCTLLIRGQARRKAGDTGTYGRSVLGVRHKEELATAQGARDGSGGRLGRTAAAGEVGHGAQGAEKLAKWGLSPAQTEAVLAALTFLEQEGQAGGPASVGWRGRLASLLPRRRQGKDGEAGRFLLWAVTGAGKTEMIFPLLERELNRGGRALVATPRRDVVLELLPRLRKAFPDRTVVGLYGGSEERWESGDITLATTHQLLRFHQGFGLVIIDELDAFPYHNDPMLQYAAEQSVRPGGQFVFLSATPPAGLQREARAGHLPHVRVPVRFHRHPLPVPRCLGMKPLEQHLARRRLPAALRRELAVSLKRGAQIFLFVPKIKVVPAVVQLLRTMYPDIIIDGTSSQDEERAEKVIAFREGRIRLLVTTTILERGVTVPKTDVFIVGAESALFDEAALVQMAGRAGRSKDDPKGRVLFAGAARTRSQTGAIRQIKRMNRIARAKGYLLEEQGRERQ
ncbi:hypothetical protein J31TS4_42590 [Paenibacillus sp. J31TS4]|uniref:DEAD/DEAH box helicase n=1 Tax=Paenibacillus sp. J31TS4 TaxID=2807195 RepID=UPI001B19C00B|nr:helicase-related protein [Paenibacillus sp. J31TS4]GIP40979.1 hypothetical protein J31TS4_42590 [Paenibacillus sp. J31TS4]